MSEDLKARLEAYYRRIDKDFEISNLTPITDGWETEVYSFTVTLHHQSFDFILRMYPGDNVAAKWEREVEALTVAKPIYGVPVPYLSRNEADPAFLGKPFIIMQKIVGRPLGEVMREDAARQPELLTRFVQLFVDLHRFDYTPDVEHLISFKPAIYAPVTPEIRRKVILVNYEQTWAAPVLDWLEANKVQEAETLSARHGDFHPHNVLITPDDELCVIDWSGFSVGDYRSDLAWTLLLISTSGYPQLRDVILSEYARIAGKPVEQIEYFDVLAALRRLVDFAVSVGSGAEAMGMRPETVAIMRGQHDRYQQVYALLQTRTGLRLPEIEQLLNGLDADM